MCVQKKYCVLIITGIAVASILYSCSLGEETAFERVVAYYHQTGDTLKEHAAEYLMDNSQWHFGVKRQLSKEFEPTYMDALAVDSMRGDSVFQSFFDSLNVQIMSSKPVLDRDTITDEFLRENIDLAFDSWQRPWAKGVGFDDFCRYILPYRNGDEELNGWRRMFKEKYEASITDSVADPSDMRSVIDYLLRCIRREVAYGGSMGLVNRSYLTPEMMERLHWMECKGCAHYTTLVMRACGIPCATMEINWRFTEVPHYTVLFPAVGNNHREFRATVGDTVIYMGEAKDSMAAWRVWETDYAADPARVDLLKEFLGNATLKKFASPVTRTDITSKMCRTFNLTMPVPDSLRREKYLFLCRFHDWKWIPVREGLVDGDSVRFADTTIRQWYRIGYANGDSVRTFGHAFTLIGSDGIADVNDRIQVYGLSRDTILYRLAYRDKVKEGKLRRPMTTYYWSKNKWNKLSGTAVLWGFNPKTGEYKVYEESMRDSDFRPDFHLLDVRLPTWTVFYDDILKSPFGFIQQDSDTGEGVLMQF